jgi:hypothetical protein
VLVMNLRGELSGGLLRLEKTKDGQSAQGAFLDIQRVQFMALHDPSDMQPSRLPNLKAYNSEPVVERVCLSESVFAPSLLRNNNFAFFLQWEFPRARTRWPQNIKTGIVTPYFIDQASRTIVKFCPTEQAGEWQVEARGKQLLWTELLHAYRRWLDLGCPKLTDYRVEIDMTGGQFVKVATTRSGNLPLPTWVIQS